MKAVNPRHGTMQVWPRKRANRPTARVRSWQPAGKGLLGFAGFKAGMTRVLATDAHKTSITKGEEIAIPATIIECPPLKIYSVRAYTEENGMRRVLKEIVVGKDKHLFRKLLTKKADTAALDNFLSDDIVAVSLLVLTQPSATGIGRKKPDVLEIQLGGSNDECITFIKEHLTSGIKASEIFKEGDYLDLHAVTTGKGYQGSVKRFGVSLKHHKSEKGVRRVGALGGWKSQQHWQYRIAYPGQMGYHQRVQYNNQILKISDKPEEVNPRGGLVNYGVVKNEYLLVRGSVPGPKKRLITLLKPVRMHRTTARTVPTIEKISTRSQQRR